MLDKVFWLGHASFRIVGPPTIYVDPWKLADGAPKADLILITHEHHDHYSPDDIAKVAGPTTQFVAPASVPALPGDVHVVRPGDTITVLGVGVRAVPAYNVTKQFHPKSAGHVGYVITVGGRTIYVAGDTDAIPEMASLRVDVALLPVGGRYTMTADEAAEAANAMRPKLAVPTHYGSVVGGAADAERFKRLCRVPVEILPLTVP